MGFFGLAIGTMLYNNALVVEGWLGPEELEARIKERRRALSGFSEQHGSEILANAEGVLPKRVYEQHSPKQFSFWS